MRVNTTIDNQIIWVPVRLTGHHIGRGVLEAEMPWDDEGQPAGMFKRGVVAKVPVEKLEMRL